MVAKRRWLLLATIFVTLQIVFTVPGLAISEGLEITETFGERDTLHVYPSDVRTVDWGNLEAVLAPDLPEDSIYQQFSINEAANIPIKTTPVPVQTAPIDNETTDSSSPNPEGRAEEEVVDTVPQADPEPAPETIPVNSEPEEAAAVGETTVLKRATESVLTFFSLVTDKLPLAQNSTTTPVEPETEVAATEPTITTTEDNSAEAEAESTVTKAKASSSVEVVEVLPELEEPSSAATTSVAEPVVETTEPELSNASSTPIAASTTPEVSEDTVVADLPDSFDTYEMTFSDFSVPRLQPGEAVTGVQLRASLAAKYESVPGEPLPTLTFVYHTKDEEREIGTVVIDDEVSNALNGGYFLFALPQTKDLKIFDDVSIEVIFTGDRARLTDIFFDALWLEIATERITKADLERRTEAEVQKHLKQPSVSQLVSTELDFTRYENPTFNLRYVSQRSKPVEAIREFLGQAKVHVKKAEILHHGEGLLGVKPDITVTPTGLVTIVIPDKERAKMKPGEYTVELTVDEGGRLVTESFSFQWGLLAINPDQALSEVGSEVDISMGALSLNGNTICDANLRLFVVDPAGAVAETPVTPSGQCSGNNVIDVPDYSASYTSTLSGTHEFYLERLDEFGSVLSHTSDTFEVTDQAPLSITRVGPTRIYPPAPYDMTLTIDSDSAFSGTVTEVVPKDFKVFNTNARVQQVGGRQELTWDVDLLSNDSASFSYSFDAPDLSPFLYELGPALVDGKTKGRSQPTVAPIVSASSTASSSQTASAAAPANISGGNGSATYQEHRTWQIASDATGNMVLYFDGASIPSGWACISCSAATGTAYQTFAVGSSTYNVSGGATTHTHTASGSVLASSAGATETGTGSIAPVSHTHTYSPTIASASNIPLYRELRMIQYTGGAGEPATIPAGAIGVFDASVPAGWTQYSAQDNYYIRSGDVPGATGGSNTHTHGISGSTGASSGSGTRVRGTPTQVSAATDAHTHTVTGSTASVSTEPPYITAILGQLGSDAAPPNGLISMWTDEVPTGWVDSSSDVSAPFYNRFVKASTTYGVTGGSATDTPADVALTSSAPVGTTNGVQSGSPAGSSGTHTHTVNITGFSAGNHLPPYDTFIYGKRQGTNPVYEQASFQWFANTNNANPTDPWPSGGTDVSEGQAITTATTPVKDGDIVRLRINAGVTNATSTAGASFKLQYAAADTCASGQWFDVGDAASTTVWRGYAGNTTPSDQDTLTTFKLASSTVYETYNENGYATTTPNDINVDEYGEWDFVLEHNGADAGTNYCFRMIEADGTAFATYTTYPELITNGSPASLNLTKPFDNEKTASTSLKFRFVSTDPESDSIHYQIQIDDTYAFTSTIEDRTSISNSSQFENLVQPADKPPFNSGEQIEFTPVSSFTNGTTYYWRVRGQDPSGSAAWGEWSEIYSFTIDTSLTASAWFQTTNEQFLSNTNSNLSASGGSLSLASGSTTGTSTTNAITFTDGDSGTAWDSLVFADTETSGDLKYHIEYNDGSDWALIPDSDLSGNAAGFDTSPVDLLGLDTDTYAIIRLVANFTNSGGSPSLQDWTVNWGYRVETPTITKLFPNEKTGTTTPTFEFTTSDPQGDSLTYQISWSTDYAFTSSTTRTSDVPGGFVNIDNGGDTDPFDSGDTIQYTIQAADTLTNNTTYWWRVRAKDTTGDNAYSFWTDPQSFTVDTTVIASTWFQTTEEQFETNILSGTVGLASDAVGVATTATEALVVYGEDVATAPRYRQWDGSAWGNEGTMQDIGAPLRWARVKAGTQREEYIAVTLGTDADINGQIFSNGSWSTPHEFTNSVSNISARGFDIAYETLSGDAVVVYCDGDANPSYEVYNGSSWTSPTTITVAETTNCDWIKLASDPTSDEILMVMRGSDGNPYEVWVWNGAAWANSTTFGSITEAAHEGMALAYEESGGQAIVAVSDGNPARFRYNIWNGSAWAGAATQGIDDDFEWGTMVSDIGSDELALCYQDEDTNIGIARWSGSAWAWSTADEVLTTTGKSKTNPGFACAFETNGSRDNYIMTTYTDTTQTNYSFWNNTSWSTGAQINSIGDTITMDLQRTGDGLLLGLFFDDTNDQLLSSMWNGSSWSTTATLETNASVDTTPYGRPFSIAPRNSGRSGTTIVSPGIKFTDGSGPYWQQMSWNDTTPGTSDILYSVQYYDGASWDFIPDSAIPGNSTGTSTSPIDLTGLNKVTYNEIRPYASLSCDASSNCPSLQDWTVEWAEGIAISGTAYLYDESTPVTSGTVAVAVNGVLQTGKTGAISGGNWTISNVNVSEGDVVTVFVSGASDANEAVGVTRYDGTGDITGFNIYERHVALGSNDATSTPLTNSDVALYNATNNEDVFLNITGSALNLCADVACSDVTLFINASTTFTPGGTVNMHDLRNNGRLTATSTLYVTGSWDNNATTTMTGSTVVFSATSSTESIDSTGATQSSFNSVTFGTTTGNATWTLASNLDVNGALNVTRGTLARGTTPITVASSLTTGASGFWTGLASTTFDGTAAATWSDNNATKQNIGYAVIDGTNKVVTLGSDVLAQSVTIGSDDTLDASATGFDITLYSGWVNNNTFVPRTGAVLFAATTTGQQINAGSSAFYDLSFTGVGGSWSFVQNTLTVNNDFTIATGTVTMPTATTTLSGSFNNSGGTFGHSNGTIRFTSNGVETITANGDAFLNPFHNLAFTGGGTWTFLDTNATSTGSITVSGGSVTLPAGTFAITGSLQDTGGTLIGNGGTVQFDTTTSSALLFGGSTLSNLAMVGSGALTVTDTNATLSGDVYVDNGSLTLPSGTLTVGGSWDNKATVVAGSGTVLFNSSDGGETVDFGTSDMYDVTFSSASGGWAVASATSTNNYVLTAGTYVQNSGSVLTVSGAFTNSVGGASTTWSGTTLRLLGGDYAVNTKTDASDSYEVVEIGGTTDVDWWNSNATTYQVAAGGSLYSQDHAAVDGSLYIFGDYERTTGTEYWTYATDFDGTALTGSERQVDVRFASGATAAISNATLNMTGDASASTTVANQGSGTYTVSVTGGTTTAQYYAMSDLGSSGLSLLSGVAVPFLRYGSYTVAAPGGSAITLSSTTIDANPGKQINNVQFATSTAISAFNVAQTDGAPTSYWWFRNGSGNLYGEDYDNDTGDPGSVRFDDSSLIITISGTVYTNDGSSPLVGGTCDDGGTTPVRVVVSGGGSYSGTCASADGSFSIGGIVVVGDPTLTIYLDGATGGEKAVTVTKTPTADITDLDLYVNRVITRHEDTEALTIADLAKFDYDNDPDIQFIAATGTSDTLFVNSGNELHVFASTTFTPGGAVTLAANATGNSYDGSLHLGVGATFTGSGTTTYTVGGSITQEAGASFAPASTTILMTATTSGKAITVNGGGTLTVHDLVMNGSGGSWNFAGAIDATGDIDVTQGTVTGTANITLENGSLSGNGLVSLGGGTVTIEQTNTLGGTQGWTFNNLTLGNGSVVGTTTPAGTATTTVGGVLTIANAHFLNAGSSQWDLSGSGSVLVETGTLLEDTSTFTYSGIAATNLLSTDYYNLRLAALGGSPTYTATGLGIQVFGDLSVGGASTTLVNFDTNDTALNVDGNFTIANNGTFIASGSGSFTLAGNYTNNGTFTASGGTLTLDGSGSQNFAAGNSALASIDLTGSGSVSVTEHATATATFTIGNGLTSFTLASGQTLAVSGTFANELGGAATTWTGSNLFLTGGGNYEINPKTVADTYATLTVGPNTQIRAWNTDASSIIVSSTGSLYSMDHAGVNGDLNIYGAYAKTSGTDHWSYGTDFDGASLSGSERQVSVAVAAGGSARYAGTAGLSVLGDTVASTTIANQGSGEYALSVGGSASTTFNYYQVENTNSSGLTFSGTPTVVNISRGHFILPTDGYSAITVGGTAITQNPAKTFTSNIFSFDTGITTGTNVTATGTSVSSWRFTNHAGDFDGESFDSDPDGDPGYVVWDDSAASITIAGTVYSDEGSSVSTVCDSTTANITLVVAGLTATSTSCNGDGVGGGTGQYSFSGIAYSPGDSLIVYINGETEKAATVTEDPVSSIANMDLYEYRVIVRHESTDPLSIADMAVYDSSDDGDIPFTAVTGSPDTLTLPADRKLIVWDNKTFAPAGNVTLTNGGSQSYGGSLELYDGATFTAAGTEVHSIGGSLLSGSGATYTAANSTTTFTTTGAGRTIDINDGSFYNVTFTGSGSWTVTDTVLDVQNFSQSAGSLTLPSGTTTVSGSFTNTAGTFTHTSGPFVFDGSGASTVRFNGNDAPALVFTGNGSWNMVDTNATSTSYVTVADGTLTLPSGTFTVEGSFRNEGGAVTHNTSELIISTSTVATVLASSSDLFGVTFRGAGTYSFVDSSLTLLDDLLLESGSLTLASGTLSVGGSFNATGGTFAHATGTVLFNSSDTGETVNPGSSDFYNVVFGSGTGGWTVTGSATTTNNFTLSAANSFTQQTGTTLYVGNVFSNAVGGAATTWTGSTLILGAGAQYELNTKSTGGDDYETLVVSGSSDVSMWNSSATTTTVATDSSLYSQDHAANDGDLYIYGDYHIGTTTEYWSYATDFDGTSLSGSERAVTVAIASGATTTLDGGTLNIVGSSGNETTITNQGSGTYHFAVNDGTFNAQRYAYRNLDASGLTLTDTPVISSFSYGDFELAVNGGNLISLSSTTLNANASLIIIGNRFATTTAITGTNVNLTGSTANAWTFTGHTGNLDGEDFDVDGGTACGSVRWDDSSCLLLQQTEYRWRNDDGGLGVPDTEWYDSNWTKRQSVSIDNQDNSDYTDPVVEVTVPYDSDMQADFDDLRFTDEDGTTALPYFIASTTSGVAAEVWVKVPELLAQDTARLYLYYGNAVATSSSSSTTTFIAADDFEDNNITEYTGAGDDKSLFVVGGTHAYGSSYGLDNTGSVNSRADEGGMARFDQSVPRGNTIRYMQYVSTNGDDDEVCTMFAVQSPITNNENYAVCFEQVTGTDYFTISKNVTDTANSGTTLGSTNMSYTTGWYEVEIDWASDDSFFVSIFDDNENLVATTTGTDGGTPHTTGGFGFTYWFNEGGWDNFSVRPTLTTEPSVRFGAEVGDSGATWKAAQNTGTSYNPGDVARLRLAIENSGLAVTNQNFDLEYAAKGAAPSCEAVDPTDYATVPNQASCGSSPVCMQSTSNYANADATADLLSGTEGAMVAGQTIESPAFTTGNINLAQDTFTELEYAITPTVNATDTAYCLRVTDGGTDLDTYLRVAELQLRFDPVFGAVSFNNGADITLLPGTTTRVYATATVTDLNGYADLVAGSSTMYTNVSGAACTADDNDCYITTTASQCSFTNCAGNSCVLECYADFEYFADPTDDTGGDWYAYLEAIDSQDGSDFNTSAAIDVLTLNALTVNQAIGYGSLEAASSTGTYNASTSVINIGNNAIDITLEGTDLTDGASSTIATSYQKYATTTFDYNACVSCTNLSTTTGSQFEVDLSKPTAPTPPVADVIYWGIFIPFGTASNPHTGFNTFYAVSDTP